MTAAAERHLLFGLLALQNGLIDQVQLVAAFQAWTLDKARALADHLLALGHLSEAQRAVVEAMADLHVAKHGDLKRSLAAIPAGRSTHESLAQLDDPDIEGSLAQVRSQSTRQHGEADADADCTASYSVGSATSDGLRFRVLRPHARGGLGAVFVALDNELHREVALKQILDSHADDPVSRQRFLLEAEVTGGLEHPGIVPVYGLGTYDGGRPYYAMRFVRGDSLKEAIDRFHKDEALKSDRGRRSLELRKLLRRFTDVCNAIEYAHSRGVLHRDIKPGNIIVGKHGETLVVDWGLAKATGRTDPSVDSDERALVPSSASGSAETLPGSALGTPAYMSPEQAVGDIEHLGPRSDVYNLGGTLYYLLTGRPPVEGEIGDVLRAVQRGDVPPPRQHDATIDPALEAVCLKAIARLPEERYHSPKALAEDVERWMADEPVEAWHEPFDRRARRWARRNRTAVGAVAVALVAGVIGLGAIAAVQARANGQLRDANETTRQALRSAEAAQARIQAALDQSKQSRQQAEAVSSFLVEAFRSPDPSQDGLQVKVADLLDRASTRLDKEFAGSRAAQGRLFRTLGITYYGLGLYNRAADLHAKARAVLETALGPDDPETLKTSNNLALAYRSEGRLAEAISLHKTTLERQAAKLGPDHPSVLKSCNNLAIAYNAAGRLPEAIALYEPTLKSMEAALGPDHRDTLAAGSNLAIAYWSAGRQTEAIALFESLLKKTEAKLGPNHPETLASRNNLAVALENVGRLSEASVLHQATLKRREADLGGDHPATLASRNNLATTLLHSGRFDEAIALFQLTLEQKEKKLGANHPDSLLGRNNLANAYLDAGRLSEAIALHELTLKDREVKLGPDHPDTLQSRSNLAEAFIAAGRISEAIALHRATIARSEAKLGPDHPLTLSSRSSLGAAYLAAGRLSDAIAVLAATLRLREAKLGRDHRQTILSRTALATAYESEGRWAESERLFRDVLASRRKEGRPDSLLLAKALALLGRNLVKQQKWIEAEPLLRESLAIREKSAPDAWIRYQAMSLLGEALLGQGRHSEAEPLIILGYEGIKARESRIGFPERAELPQVAERVVHLYDSWDKPERAAEWKARLGLRDLPADVFRRP